jgi:hypothetical protein
MNQWQQFLLILNMIVTINGDGLTLHWAGVYITVFLIVLYEVIRGATKVRRISTGKGIR